MDVVALHHHPEQISTKSVDPSGVLRIFLVTLKEIDCICNVLKVAQQIKQYNEQIHLLQNSLVDNKLIAELNRPVTYSPLGQGW
jgi:hypothetical protein